MKLFLTSAYRSHSCLDRVRELYDMDVHGLHQVVHEPKSADAIVFIENTQFHDMQFKRLMEHSLVKQYPEKVYMYNEMDQAWPLLPGLYCSLSARMSSYSDYVAFPYLNVSNTGIQNIHTQDTPRKWLFSFVGSNSHSVRKDLFSITDPRANIVDTSSFCTWNPAQTSKYAYQKLYTDTMAESQFVLCPRGIGPASLRLYETIEAGRIPVIISDSWVPPPQIDWSFAVRIPEWDIASIPRKLRELEPEWQDRSQAARAAWESTYSPDTLFNTLGTAIDNISRSANVPEHSLKVAAHKWRVVLAQEARNWLKPPAGLPGAQRLNTSQQSLLNTLLGRLFSR